MFKGQKVNNAPSIISDYMMCEKFKTLPTAPSLYQEKNKIVQQFKLIKETISELEEKENRKNQRKGG